MPPFNPTLPHWLLLPYRIYEFSYCSGKGKLYTYYDVSKKNLRKVYIGRISVSNVRERLVYLGSLY